jgi:CubicO group peptidase (beta-lactamase class C family)
VEFLKQSYTDGLLVTKNGSLVAQYFANNMSLNSPHLTFSVSKSITGIVAGIVLKKFDVSSSTKISEILKSASNGAYAEATIRNLLDMTVSLDFDEVYTSKEGTYARYRQAMLWMSRSSDSDYFDEDLATFILSLPKASHEHGYVFTYKSPNSDLLGLVLQEISGLPLPHLISEYLWKPLGCDPATITVDDKNMARTAGGLSCSIKDLTLVGELMRRGGIHNGKSLIDPMWVVDTFGHGDKEAWSRGEFFESFPEGSYRNQWYKISEDELCAIGIHGQWIYLNSSKDVVITKFSCQPKADDDELDRQTLDFFRGVCAQW